jgi:hypothetical protein
MRCRKALAIGTVALTFFHEMKGKKVALIPARMSAREIEVREKRMLFFDHCNFLSEYNDG